MRKVSLVVSLVLLVWGLAGCSTNSCKKVRKAYDAALRAEPTLRADLSARPQPVHLGVALRSGLVSAAARKALNPALDRALNLKHTMKLGMGRALKVHVDGRALDIKFLKDRSCDTCYRIVGDLGGFVKVQNPMSAGQKIPLSGSFSIIAPLSLEPAPQGVTLSVELRQLRKFKGSFMNLELDQLPDTWNTALRQPLAAALLKHLSGTVKTLDLFTVKAPTLNIKGFKVAPTGISAHPDRGMLFLGMTTNLPGVSKPAEGVKPETALNMSSDEDLAVVVHPKLWTPIVRLGLRNGTIPRRADLTGKAAKQGDTYTTAQAVSISADRLVEVGFRGWRLAPKGADAMCYWFDGTLTGAIDVREGALSVDMRGATLGKTSLAADSEVTPPDLTGWKDSGFAGATGRMIANTLSGFTLHVAGAPITAAPRALRHKPEGTALYARTALIASAPATSTDAQGKEKDK